MGLWDDDDIDDSYDRDDDRVTGDEYYEETHGLIWGYEDQEETSSMDYSHGDRNEDDSDKSSCIDIDDMLDSEGIDIDEFNAMSHDEKEEMLSEYGLDSSELDDIDSTAKTIPKTSVQSQVVSERNTTITSNTSSNTSNSNTTTVNNNQNTNQSSAGDSFAVGCGALIIIVFVILLIAGVINFLSKIPLVVIEPLIFFGIAAWAYYDLFIK